MGEGGSSYIRAVIELDYYRGSRNRVFLKARGEALAAYFETILKDTVGKC